MKTNAVLFLIAIVTLFGCEVNEEIPVDTENLLLGNWANAKYNSEDQSLTYERVLVLEDDKSGISFKEENIYVERTSGWCGTPPLVFFNIEGTFVLENNIIKVQNNYYPSSFNWNIVTLTEEKLVVSVALSDQEKEHQELMNVFTEIKNLSESVSCSDKSDWSFTAYGSKACGGPQGYIPYSNQIDVNTFLTKVQLYTALEDAFNQKWQVISTCDVESPPVDVACDAGKPILVYNQTL